MTAEGHLVQQHTWLLRMSTSHQSGLVLVFLTPLHIWFLTNVSPGRQQVVMQILEFWVPDFCLLALNAVGIWGENQQIEVSLFLSSVSCCFSKKKKTKKKTSSKKAKKLQKKLTYLRGLPPILGM